MEGLKEVCLKEAQSAYPERRQIAQFFTVAAASATRHPVLTGEIDGREKIDG
jgi:hypothetical protein